MGCDNSKQINLKKELLQKQQQQQAVTSLKLSQQGATNEAAERKADKNKIDALRAEGLAKNWVKSYNIKEDQEEVTYGMVLKDVLSLLRTWPRGESAGCFLEIPKKNDLDIPNRGVKVSWLVAAWNHMTSSTERNLISTRMFVELLVRPLLENSQGDGWTMFDFIPTQYRSDSPSAYLSHAWDGYFRHILFFPDNVKKFWGPDPSLWIDFFACPLADDGPNPEMLDLIQMTLQKIGRTCVVFPGDGTAQFALLPMTRSWCIFEMLNTPKEALDYRVGLHGDLNDLDFHNSVVAMIDQLSIEGASASFLSDQAAIKEKCVGETTSSTLRQIARAAFAKRYEAIPTTPTIAQRLSTSSNQHRRSNSMSDIYTVEEQIELHKVSPPDF